MTLFKNEHIIKVLCFCFAYLFDDSGSPISEEYITVAFKNGEKDYRRLFWKIYYETK